MQIESFIRKVVGVGKKAVSWSARAIKRVVKAIAPIIAWIGKVLLSGKRWIVNLVAKVTGAM
ncbi:hypothetical protein C8N35_11631 [Breoghania corrubedonensis]|uniref:Uncharacterized protein n=1 Tax=Breoghania corrubedonensis TaxID=665038 RepID=A0A2T5UPZ2_9HYPH|nr:hypothetical protein [Breoghania corrubedonensis]PTW53576.1 hypothetical protein C8N35_11631 [Breoghania corrubedonensis]